MDDELDGAVRQWQQEGFALVPGLVAPEQVDANPGLDMAPWRDAVGDA